MDNEEVQWMIITKAFGFTDKFPKVTPYSHEEWISVISVLQEVELEEIIVNLTLDAIWNKLRKEICPKFWSHFKSHSTKVKEANEKETIVDAVSNLVQALKELHLEILNLIPYVERCQKVCEVSNVVVEGKLGNDDNLLSLLKLHLQATLYSQLPPLAFKLVKEVYSAAFKLFSHKKGHFHLDNVENTEFQSICRSCSFSNEDCQCSLISQAFDVINGILQELELLERMAGNIIEDLLLMAIEDHVSVICKDSFDKHRIQSLENWVEKVSTEWLEFIYSTNPGSSQDQKSSFKKGKIEMYKSAMYHKYTSTRIKQLFNIVIEYPDSQPALEDLRECLEKTDLRDTLVKSLKQAIKTRLLHPGVTTEDILHAYISAIKGLRVLDPKGILLELVSEPIRQYLRGRSDFVRYIAIILTDSSCSELSDELVVAAPLVLDDSYSEIEDMNNWEAWTPDPMHAQSSVKSKSQRTADIISMLVNIYGSKTIFINEYGTILADRILSQFSYDTEREIMYLEHLKVRFGESLSPLHKCEVMVKDVADSKRINATIQSAEQNSHVRHKFPISAMILSSQFWPTFKEQSLQLPDEVLKEMEIYTEAYQSLKGNRTLNWKPHLGQVELEIELKNRTLHLVVTPTKATIIHHFEKKPKWALEDLSKVTLIPKGILRQKIAFWQAQGLVQEAEQDVFALVEDDDVLESRNSYLGGAPYSSSQDVPLSASACLEDEAESVMASAQDQRQEELQVLWSYIVGMLTNLESVSLERIHAMLKMFIQDTVECSLEELRAFLEMKMRQHQIILANGMYRLPKN
ncbi:UNVERIFIED_CONTAM: hypothetical protein RMT77_018062 [Armadillidium vulgare]